MAATSPADKIVRALNDAVGNITFNPDRFAYLLLKADPRIQIRFMQAILIYFRMHSEFVSSIHPDHTTPEEAALHSFGGKATELLTPEYVTRLLRGWRL